MLHSSWFWNHPQLKLGHQLFKWAGLKPLADISLYWLVHRDPSNGLWNNPYRTAQSIFYIQQITTGFGHRARGYLKFFRIFLWKYSFRQTCNPSNQGKCVKWSTSCQLPIATSVGTWWNDLFSRAIMDILPWDVKPQGCWLVTTRVTCSGSPN